MLSSDVSDYDRKAITRFVEIFMSHSGEGYALNVPKEMIVGEADNDGWAEWKAVDSPVSENDIKNIEKKIGYPLPSLFRAYLMYKCLLMTDFIVRLPQTPVDNPLKEFEQYVKLLDDENSYFRINGLIPFGFDSNDAGPVCFDTKAAQNSDYPIVLIDTTAINKIEYKPRVVWRNFEDLLKNIENDMLSYD